MTEKLILLSEKLYKSEPFFKGREIDFKIEFHNLSKAQKKNFLIYSFKRYDISFTISILLYLPCLWEKFDSEDWKNLIKNMFPRNVIYENSLKDIQTGQFTDILFLNGIIGINPFDFIFNNLDISSEEKTLFFDFFKHRGEYSFYINLRELIEDIVNFYDLEIFEKIVIMKEKLIQEGFTPTVKYEEIIENYSFLDTRIKK